MKQTVDLCQFSRAFEALRPDDFSYNGLAALFDYFEGLEDDTGEEAELDVIGICCEFCEYDTLEDVADEYDYKPDSDDDLDDDEKDELFVEWLSDRTQVIEFEGGVIIRSF